MKRTWACVAGSLFLGVGVVACAAPPRAAQAPAGPSTAADARAAILEARAELGDVEAPAVEVARAKKGEGAAPTSVGGAPSPTASAAAEATADEEDHRAGCARKCEAFASLERAVTTLCRLVGDGDRECVEARGSEARGAEIVARCGCR